MKKLNIEYKKKLLETVAFSYGQISLYELVQKEHRHFHPSSNLEPSKADVKIVQSPVGMPGRALNNLFIREVEKEPKKVRSCYQCLEKCKPAEVPYCITKALVDAVKGDVENGLVFCGSNVGRINRMQTVHELMCELAR